ncbi:MAG: stage 0 sporulation family protein [Clostridia bacterium]|nr:stage 0 sporulation family protein [Clostridia bacterium]
MVTVVGIRFKKAGKIYYFDPVDTGAKKDEYAIVETARGIEFGSVVVGPKEVSEEDIVSPLKNVVRVATEEDIQRHTENLAKEEEALRICNEKVAKHELDMKLIDVEYTFDNNKVIFYFTADGRVDFRELVKDLASVFRTRIELRQIGVRDEAKMVNGIGPCGVGLCCANWLGDFAPVSIKMAKDQNLSLNPSKISGICGRLMCCLKYEHEVYIDLRKGMPAKGDKLVTPEGRAVVVETTTLKEEVKVRLIIDEKTNELGEDILTFKKKDVKIIGAKKRSNKGKDGPSYMQQGEEVNENELKKLED